MIVSAKATETTIHTRDIVDLPSVKKRNVFDDGIEQRLVGGQLSGRADGLEVKTAGSVLVHLIDEVEEVRLADGDGARAAVVDQDDLGCVV